MFLLKTYHINRCTLC